MGEGVGEGVRVSVGGVCEFAVLPGAANRAQHQMASKENIKAPSKHSMIAVRLSRKHGDIALAQ